MSFQFEPSSSAISCAMVEAMCWPISALPTVTVTRPSGPIEYQTLGSKLGGGCEGLIATEQARNGGIAERQTGRSGSDEEGATAEIGGLALRDFHVLIHVGLRSPALDAVRISAAARMIAFWMRE